jgi:hypothetical protein
MDLEPIKDFSLGMRHGISSSALTVLLPISFSTFFQLHVLDPLNTYEAYFIPISVGHVQHPICRV